MKIPLIITLLCIGIVPSLAGPSWIWSSKSPGMKDKVTFRTTFEVPKGGVSMAELRFTCDNGSVAFLNGKKVATNFNWREPVRRDLTDSIIVGENKLTFQATNKGGGAGFVAKLSLKQKNGVMNRIESGASWQAQPEGRGEWFPATVIAPYGAGPWGKALDIKVREVVVEDLVTLPGFKTEKLYTVPKDEQGSWVAMTVDSKGDLITGDQYGGLYRVKLPGVGSQEGTRVEKLKTQVEGAHGLCYIYDSLYLLKNEQKGERGLYRLRDTNDDGQFDEETFLRAFKGGGEHGLHSIIPSPDGKSLHLIFGNSTRLPEDLDHSRPARAWGEDHLLPRMWDASGHARGRMAPGGFILKTDADAKEIELIASGFRNQFDAAFDQNGELFTFDADMEWDLGSPWYRPTRVYHVVSGLDAGWRSGTGKWKDHYPDTLLPIANVGPGSPTGVAMGTGARFPAKYQRALFINDWTYGTMYAVHFIPKGGGFESEVEEFLSGRPLPLTDLIIHPQDGAMYYMVGGRRTQSSLYRVTYTGSELTSPVKVQPPTPEAKLRKALELAHATPPSLSDLEMALANLNHADRFIRHAARVVLEKQVGKWDPNIVTGKWAVIEAMVALARTGEASQQEAVLSILGKLDPKLLSKEQFLGWLRAHSLAFTRMGKPQDQSALIARFAPLLPSGDNAADLDLVELLIYLGDAQIVSKALQLMAIAKDDQINVTNEATLERNEKYAKAAMKVRESRPNLQQYSYLFLLRNAKIGWSPALRQTYFSWFPIANQWNGGNSLKKFIENIRKEALLNIAPESEKEALDDLSKTTPKVMDLIKPAVGPGRAWTVAAAVTELKKRTGKRNFARGKELYAAAACASCHQMAGEGGGIGPDLTGSGNRYSLADLLENIIEPSKVISDQYGSETITKTDGSVVIGRIGGETEETLSVMTNPFAPDSLIEIPVKDVKSREAFSMSMMPPGLINAMNPDELADLVAYMMSGGVDR